MMGYGMSANVVKDQLTALHSRSLWITDNTGNNFAYACAEICFITPAIRREVLDLLESYGIEFKREQIMLSAQHTHSAPGGYSEYAMYNFSIPGFHKDVFEGIVKGIAESLKLAWQNRREGELDFVDHQVDPSTKIGWNRALKAYNQNPENEVLSEDEGHLGIDTRMRMLRILRDGKPNGQVNWFGVHATCVGKENHSISFDNKGYAANFFEQHGREIGIFAQGLAGDVSPYYHGPGDVKLRKKIQGVQEHEYAKKNGKLQSDEAEKAYSSAHTIRIEGEIDSELHYYDFSDIEVDPAFGHGDPDPRTGPACHGVAFFNGTRIDGRGLTDLLHASAKFLSDSVKIGHTLAIPFKTLDRQEDWKEKYRVHGSKKILIDASEHRIFGTTNLKGLIIPGFADPTIAEVKKEYVNEAVSEHQWVPHVLPVQIAIVGNIAFVGCPGELTVTAGKRLEQPIQDKLKARGVNTVVMCPYSNAYMGYVTTFEEYQEQTYEGGHTIYGQWTLGAFQTKFQRIAGEMLRPKPDRVFDDTQDPVEFSEEELSKRSY